MNRGAINLEALRGGFFALIIVAHVVLRCALLQFDRKYMWAEKAMSQSTVMIKGKISSIPLCPLRWFTRPGRRGLSCVHLRRVKAIRASREKFV